MQSKKIGIVRFGSTELSLVAGLREENLVSEHKPKKKASPYIELLRCYKQ